MRPGEIGRAFLVLACDAAALPSWGTPAFDAAPGVGTTTAAIATGAVAPDAAKAAVSRPLAALVSVVRLETSSMVAQGIKVRAAPNTTTCTVVVAPGPREEACRGPLRSPGRPVAPNVTVRDFSAFVLPGKVIVEARDVGTAH